MRIGYLILNDFDLEIIYICIDSSNNSMTQWECLYNSMQEL